MILIANSTSKKIALNHFNACKDDVSRRLDFLIDFCDALGNSNYISLLPLESISKKYNMLDNSLKRIIDPILLPKYKFKDSKAQLTNPDLLAIMRSGNSTYTQHSPNFYKDCFIFASSLKKDLSNIIMGSPNYLYRKYVNSGNIDDQKKYRSLLEKVLRYEQLTGKGFARKGKKSWTSYELTKSLNINVCPYCNKNWINTVFTDDHKKITNPQLDHYFSKSDYPVLRLSFYNLVPSCETCNARIKKAQELDYSTNTHPFETGFDPFGKIVASAMDTKSSQGLGENFSVNLEFENDTDNDDKVKIQETFKFFKIKPIYEKHGDIFKEIYFKHQKYGFTYLHELLSDEKFKGMKIEDLYQLIYGNYINIEDYKKRPFAKVTKDTVEALGVI